MKKALGSAASDTDAGKIVIDKNGYIIFFDHAASECFGIGNELRGAHYDVLKDTDSRLYGAITSAFADSKEKVEYDGISILRVKDSIIVCGGSDAVNGATEEHINASVIFSTLMIGVCIWIYCYAAWDRFDRPVSQSNMSLIILAMAFVFFVIIKRFAGISTSDIGIGTKNIGRVLITDSVIAVVTVLVFVIGKWLVIRFAPGAYFDETKPFIDFGIFRRLPILYYPLNVVAQEFVSRSVIHESLRRALVCDRREELAVVISSLLLGVCHIHMGFGFMMFAMIFLGILGVMYMKQRSIWGLCILHYFIGISATMLGWI